MAVIPLGWGETINRRALGTRAPFGVEGPERAEPSPSAALSLRKWWGSQPSTCQMDAYGQSMSPKRKKTLSASDFLIFGKRSLRSH